MAQIKRLTAPEGHMYCYQGHLAGTTVILPSNAKEEDYELLTIYQAMEKDKQTKERETQEKEK